MRTLDGTTTVYCNKVSTVTTSSGAEVMMDDDGDGDGDDDGDGDIPVNDRGGMYGNGGGGGGGNNIELARPVYEEEVEDIYTLLTNINQLGREGRERLEQYARQHTQDLEGDSTGHKKKTTPVENNKKKILKTVMEPLHKMYNCNVPLQAIDMIGVVKNGKVLCVECGVMTEYRNYNMTPYGPICMRHRYASIMKHHPIWNSVPLSSNSPPLITFPASMSPTARKRPLHHSLLIGDDRRVDCHLCHKTQARLFITLYDEFYSLLLLESCTVCYTNIRNRNLRQPLLSMRDVARFIEQKGYQC